MYECKIAEKLVELRLSKGVTQEEVAQSLSVSNKTVSTWETGASMPDLPRLVELARYYRTGTDVLLGLAEDCKQNTQDVVRRELENADRQNVIFKAFELARAVVPAMFGMICREKENATLYANLLPPDDLLGDRTRISLSEFYNFTTSSENANVAVMLLRNKAEFAWLNDPAKQRDIVKFFRFIASE